MRSRVDKPYCEYDCAFLCGHCQRQSEADLASEGVTAMTEAELEREIERQLLYQDQVEDHSCGYPIQRFTAMGQPAGTTGYTYTGYGPLTELTEGKIVDKDDDVMDKCTAPEQIQKGVIVL
jgi:hypothetical protein